MEMMKMILIFFHMSESIPLPIWSYWHY